MTDVAVSEHELAQFLETNELKTWERKRTESELSSFVLRRLELLDEIDA